MAARGHDTDGLSPVYVRKMSLFGCDLLFLRPRAAVLLGQVVQGFHQQALLALEMQVDDALAQTRFTGDRRHGRIRQAVFRHGADRCPDQLQPALFFRRGPFFSDCCHDQANIEDNSDLCNE